jgi:hypothetical protein
MYNEIDNLNELGWLFIYIFSFGISDLLVKKYIKTDSMYIIFYLFLGCIGFYIVSKTGAF